MLKCVLVIALLVGTLLWSGPTWAQPPESQIALSNESVRVAVLTFRPGAGTGRHMGLEPEVGIVLEGELTVETPNGRETLSAGRVYWIPSLVPHDVRNESERPAKLGDILLKRCE